MPSRAFPNLQLVLGRFRFLFRRFFDFRRHNGVSSLHPSVKPRHRNYEEKLEAEADHCAGFPGEMSAEPSVDGGLSAKVGEACQEGDEHPSQRMH